MPTYTVTDPASGRTLRLTGDSPPTESELEEIFSGGSTSALGMAAQANMDALGPEAPTAFESFAREAGRSVIPAGAGFLGGAGSGALAGMAGGPFSPVTVPAAALVGGLATAFGARKLQDAAADEFLGEDSWMGSQAAAEDYQTNPMATLGGGLAAGGRPSLGRVMNTAKALGTAEGRAALGSVASTLGKREGMAALQHANPAAVNAFGDVVDVTSGAGIGAGMSMASGESPGMVMANLLGGAVFNKPLIGGSSTVLPRDGGPMPTMEARPEAAPPPQPNTGLIDPVIKAKVTRIPGTGVEEYFPPVLMPERPKLGGPLALPEPQPTPRLPLAETPLAEGPGADPWIQSALADFMARQESAPPPNPPDNPMVAREMANRLREIAPLDAEGKPMGPAIPAMETAPVQAGNTPPKQGERIPPEDLEAAMRQVMARQELERLPKQEDPTLLSDEPNDQAPRLQPRLPTQENPPASLENLAPLDLPEGGDVPVTGEEGARTAGVEVEPHAKDVLVEDFDGNFITKTPTGYKVWKSGNTVSSLVGTYGQGDEFLGRAKEHLARLTAAASKKESLRSKLQSASERVGQSIQTDLSEGRNYSSIFGPLNATTAKQAYKAALDTAIAAIDLGDRIGKAMNKAVQAVKKQLGEAWKPEMEKPLRQELSKNIPTEIERRRTERQQTADFARKQVVADTKEGAPKPSEAEFKQRLAEELPDQKAAIDAEEAPQTAYDDPDLKPGDYPDAGKNTEWRDYHERTGDRVEKAVQDLKSGKSAREIGQKAASINRELFKSKSAIAHDAADGKMPGTTRSDAAKEFVDDVFGTNPGADGVAKTGADADFQRNVTKRANTLDAILSGLEPRMARMGQSDRRAFLDRVGDLMTNPDANLSKEPKDVQKAVEGLREFYDKTRDDLKDAGYDIGDFGAHSMPRIFKADMRANNPAAFHRDLVETYKAKFKREIQAAEDAGDVAEANKLRAKYTPAEAEKRALAYERNLAMNDAGISTDGDDFKLGGDDGMPNFLKAREFGEEADRLLGKYYVRNPFEVVKITGETTERLLTMARVLGKKDKNGMLDRTGRWTELRDKLMAEGNEKMVPELARVVANTFGLGERVGPKTQKFGEFTRTWMWLSFLDRAAVSSLAEPLMAGISTRSVGNAAKAFGKTLKQAARRLAKLPANESRIIAEALGYVQSGIMSRLSAAHASDPFASGGMAKMADSFFNMTGLTGWTHSTTEAISDIGFEHLATLAKLAKTNKLARKDLEGFGVKPEEIDILDGFADNMKLDRMASILGDSPGAEIIRRAHANYMRQSVVMPTHGDKALHAAHPVGQMFYGLQSYLYGYTRNVTGRIYRQAMRAASDKDLSLAQKTKVIMTLPAAFLGMGAANLGITMLRETLFHDPERARKDKKKTDGEIWKGRLMASASRANFLGAYDPLFNALTAAKYQRDPATVMVGPVWGAASELFSQLANQGGERDSANTNTSERKIAKLAYQIGVKPATSAFLSGIPATRAAGAANYAISHPAVRETFVRGTAGPMSDKNRPKKGPLPVF
jgi:hypothetical protein